MLRQRIEVKNGASYFLHLPGGQRIITYTWEDGSIRVWDLEKSTQVGEEWEDKEMELSAMILSPDGKTVATAGGSLGGTVKFWNVNTGKVFKTWTGHTKQINSLCWSPDGGRVAGCMMSGSEDGTFKVWDVENGETILGPINAEDMRVVCYSPDAKMIATGGYPALRIWDANTGKLLKTVEGNFLHLAWTSDGKTLFTNGCKIDTATWTVLETSTNGDPDAISVSPNDRILIAISNRPEKTVQLWNIETNQPIGTLLHHEFQSLDPSDISVTFSADGKFLIIGCFNGHIYFRFLQRSWSSVRYV